MHTDTEFTTYQHHFLLRTQDVNKPRYTVPRPSSTRTRNAQLGEQVEGKRIKKAPMATMSTFESSDEETSDGNYSDNDHPVERKGRQKEQKESCGLRPCGHAEGSGWVAEIHDLVYVDEEAMLVRPNICIT
jgi:hypothetical protein